MRERMCRGVYIYIIYTGCERIINGVTSRERKGKDVVGEVGENSLANYLDSVVNYAQRWKRIRCCSYREEDVHFETFEYQYPI